MYLVNVFRKTKIKNIFIFLVTIFVLILIIYYYYNRKIKSSASTENSDSNFSEKNVLNAHESQLAAAALHQSKTSPLKSPIASADNDDGNNKRGVKISYEDAKSKNPLAAGFNKNSSQIIPEKYNEHVVKMRIMKEKIKNMMSKQSKDNDDTKIKSGNFTVPVLRTIHIFYYAPVNWYKTNAQFSSPSTQQNQSSSSAVVNSVGKKLNIHFYPLHGIYDSTNLDVISKHLGDIKRVGIGTIILTWTPNYPVHLLMGIFDLAISFDLRVSIQIDNYPHRSADSIKNDIRYFMDNLGLHSALNKIYIISKKNYFPIFYVKEITQLDEGEWNRILSREGEITIRNGFYDAIVIGHITLSDHKMFIRRSNFDGFYTALPSNGATYTSTWKNWIHLKKFSDSYRLIFIPTVGPGFDEKKKQPRSGMLRRHRSGGNYYGVAWRTALSLNPKLISIASFNNWPEGSQIEQATPKIGFKDYLPGPPTKYLDLTQQFIADFVKLKETNLKHKFYCDNFLNNTIC